MCDTDGEITRLLGAFRAGDRSAFDRLVSIVYGDLRGMAHRQLVGRSSGPTLNTTGLVNEAYLKLAESTRASWENRAHFFRVASRAMRQVVVDHSRARNAAKRGGGDEVLPLDEENVGAKREAERILSVDRALERLDAVDARLVQVVECRFFAGYTEEETGRILGVTTRTVQRDWKRAKAWLQLEMTGGHGDAGR